jgi:hypothetical protein
VVAGPAARILSPSLNATNGVSSATRWEARGLLVLTAGPVTYFYGVTPLARWSRFYELNAPGVPPLSSARATLRGGKGLKAMTRTRDNQAARRRGEWARDRRSRAFDRAIQARRRLNMPLANRSGTKGDLPAPTLATDT